MHPKLKENNDQVSGLHDSDLGFEAASPGFGSKHNRSLNETQANVNKQRISVLDSYGVTSEYLPELPSTVLGTLPVGKRLFSGCVRKLHKDVTLYLLDADLWQRFRDEGTEMIITKKGRKVFPVPSYVLSDLDPQKLYNVTLEIQSVDSSVHKYSNGEWVTSKEGSHLYPTPVPGRNMYLHPFSPNTGLHWMREPVTFSGLKISNNLDAQGTSMRKYVMNLVIAEMNGPMEVEITQPETVFVAVTQYQNEKITQMKIEHNPFANGFRFASSSRSVQGKDKPKRPLTQETESEDENKLEEVSSSDRSPMGSSQDQASSDRVKPGIGSYDAARMTDYLEKKRSILKQLFPSYFDQFKVHPPNKDNLVGSEMASWPTELMASRGPAYITYSNASGVSTDSAKRGFIFHCGDGNPLAQVRQFGQMNRCSDIETPLSLVKKKKMEDTDESDKCSPESFESKSEHNMNTKQAAKDNRRFPRKCRTNNEAFCKSQTEPSDGQDENNTKTFATAKTEQHKSLPSSQSQLSYTQGSRSHVGQKLIHWHNVHHLLPLSVSELTDDNTRCMTSPKSSWPSPELGFTGSFHQSSPKDLRTSKGLADPRFQEIIRPEVILRNNELWATTHEVVVSSEGRPMFPFISLAVSKLNPDLEYHISLKLTPSSRWHYDYNDHEWIPSLEASSDPKPSMYQHPDSPRKGRLWGTDLVFDKLRLSTMKQGKNMLKVQFRRQYVPVVVVVAESQLWEYPMKDATFITVKIDRSPYVTHSWNTPHLSSGLNYGSISSENVMKTSPRKQTNPRRMNMDFMYYHPEQVLPCSSWPAVSSPINLKRTSSTSQASPTAIQQPLPACQPLSLSWSLTSNLCESSTSGSARSEKREGNLDSVKPEIITGCESKSQYEQEHLKLPVMNLPLFGGHSFAEGYNESDADSVASNTHEKSPASLSFYTKDEMATDAVVLHSSYSKEDKKWLS